MTTTPSPLARYLRKDGKEWQHTARPVRVKKQTNRGTAVNTQMWGVSIDTPDESTAPACTPDQGFLYSLFVCLFCRKLRLEKATIWQPPPPLLQNTFCQLSIRSPLMWRHHRDALTSQLDYNRRRISLLSTSCMFADVCTSSSMFIHATNTLRVLKPREFRKTRFAAVYQGKWNAKKNNLKLLCSDVVSISFCWLLCFNYFVLFPGCGFCSFF